MSKTKLSKQEQLKVKNAEAKVLREETKVLRRELSINKDERAFTRNRRSLNRKLARISKSKLSKLTASIGETFKSGDSEAINALADSLMEQATTLVKHVRTFGTSVKRLENL